MIYHAFQMRKYHIQTCQPLHNNLLSDDQVAPIKYVMIVWKGRRPWSKFIYDEVLDVKGG
jgi:hypothetical protein